MAPQVRGSLFVDYVRMLKARGGIGRARQLAPEDLTYLEEAIDLAAWYPMATFERFGLAILEAVARGDLQAVRDWGRHSVAPLAKLHGNLLVENDPRESLMRFHVLRRTFFDFEAATVTRVHDTGARLEIAYGMSPAAEEAACHQTMGFFEGLLELAGGVEVTARFEAEAWRGAKSTVLALSWKARSVPWPPPAARP